MTNDPRDPNVLARRAADLQDQIDTLRKDYAEQQEAWVLERARLTLALGMSVDEIPGHLWDDGPRIAQIAFDRIWDGGYRDGLRTVEKAVTDLLYESENSPTEDQ